MARQPLSATMAPDELAAYQRERNRKKQRAFKDRQRAAKLALARTHQPDDRRQDEGWERAASSHSLAPSCSSTSDSSPGEEMAARDSIVETLQRRVAELEETTKQLKRARYRRSPSPGDAHARPSTSVELGLRGFASPPSCSTGPSPAWSDQRPVSSRPTGTAHAPRRATSMTIFASMLHDSPPLRLPNPRSTAFNPQTLNVNLLRESLGLPHHSSPAGCLPSFTYNSPVDHSRACLVPTDSSWKIALFELHATMMANREHPIEGFLANPASRRTLAEAQLLIGQLLWSTSERREVFDRNPGLSQEDTDFLATAQLDARLALCPFPLARVQAARAAAKGDLTDMSGWIVEQTRLYGDVWDSGSSSIPDSLRLPHQSSGDLAETGHRTEAGRHLRGASIREIVLGLDLPHWRNLSPVFPPYTKWHWDDVDLVRRPETGGLGGEQPLLVEVSA